jgi:hypothetical protein
MHWITKATAQPTLEDAAACIAAVVEAERLATCPTLNRLIDKDVDKTTKELQCRIQSLKPQAERNHTQKHDKKWGGWWLEEQGWLSHCSTKTKATNQEVNIREEENGHPQEETSYPQ